MPVQFLLLVENALIKHKEVSTDSSNKFMYSMFLRPYLANFSGWAIFADRDMACQADIAELRSLRDWGAGVQVVEHHYKIKVTKKFLGNKSKDYTKKNWPSLISWKCGPPKNTILTPEFIKGQSGPYCIPFLSSGMIQIYE